MSTLKRSGMTLYSGNLDVSSHQVRLVLAEKGIDTVDIITVDEANPAEDLLELNPYGTLPTIVDRDLVLYRTPIVLEYLEERFPHPPLLPVYPVARAKSRLMMFRIEQDWYSLLHRLEISTDTKQKKKLRKELTDYFIMLAPVFAETNYFLSNDFSLVDCYVAPLLWRLPSLGIELPSSAKAVQNYAQRIFARPGFQESLSDAEREIAEGALA